MASQLTVWSEAGKPDLGLQVGDLAAWQQAYQRPHLADGKLRRDLHRLGAFGGDHHLAAADHLAEFGGDIGEADVIGGDNGREFQAARGRGTLRLEHLALGAR